MENKLSERYLIFYQAILALLSLLLVLAPKLSPLAIILLLGAMIFGLIKKQLVFRLHWPLVFLALLYFAYLIGVIFTQNPSLANRYIENKLAFVIFPLLFTFTPNKTMSLKLPYLSLLLGVAIASIMGLVHGALLYFSEGSSLYESFFSVGFSYIHHPTYFSIYIIMALAIVVFAYRQKWKYFTKLNALLLGLFLFFCLGLCVSFAALLFFVFALTAYFAWRIKAKYGIKKLTLLLFAFFLSFSLFIFFNAKFGNKDTNEVTHVIDSLVDYAKSPTKYIQKYVGYKTGNEVRMIMWTASFTEILDHPFGVGTGNVDIHLKERLLLFKQNNMLDEEYNPHNQFLQTCLEIGIVGLLLLFMFIVLSIREAIRNKNWFLLLCVSALAFNALFESMLQRQSGIVFFSFWICLLVAFQPSKRKTL